MKKIICALLCLIFLCSCSSGKNVRVVNKGVSFKAHIFCRSDKYVCSVNISEKGETSFTVTEGALSGFTALCCGDKVILSYEGKESEQKLSLFSQSVFAPVIEMFSFLESNPYSVEEEDNNYYVSGKISAGEFTMYVSPAGFPISASLDTKDFSVDFYDVTVEKVE